MEKWDARLFQLASATQEHNWNIVELESRRTLRHMVNDLIAMAGHSLLTTSEIRQYLLQGVATFGSSFATQLVRSLHRDDASERQSIVWLLTVLNDPDTVTPLQTMKHTSRLPRSVRLSASLALAGMGVETENTVVHRAEHTRHVSHTRHTHPRQLYAVR